MGSTMSKAHHRRTRHPDRTKTSKKSAGTTNNNSSPKTNNMPSGTRNNDVRYGYYVLAGCSSTSEAEFNSTAPSDNQSSRVTENEPSGGSQRREHRDGNLIGMHNN